MSNYSIFVKYLFLFFYLKMQAFLVEVFWCLFALPSPAQRFLPKCKAQASRSIAFDLLVELVKGNVENYAILHSKLIQQHSKGK